MGIHGLAAAAGQKTDDVDLVNGLGEQNAAAPGGIQFLRAARAVKKIGVVQSMDHADVPEFAAFDHPPGRYDRRIETVTRTDDQVHAGIPAGLHHGVGIVHRDCHGLVDNDMLAGACGRDHLGTMHLMGGGDIDDFDRRIGTERVDIRIGPAAEFGLEGGAGFSARRAGGRKTHARIVAECGQHQDEATPQPDDADADGSCFRGRGQAFRPSSARRRS